MLSALLFVGFGLHSIHAAVAVTLISRERSGGHIFYAVIHAAAAAGALAAAVGQP